jgi:chemotaxis protein MotB
MSPQFRVGAESKLRRCIGEAFSADPCRLCRAVATLAGVALLSACVSQGLYDRQAQKTATYQQLDERLQGEIAAEQAQVEQLRKLVKLTLSSGILFPESGGELSETGKVTLAKVAPALQGLTDQRIVVKGFTDNVPIGPELRERLPNNVELSKARAQAVAGFLVAQGVPASIVYSTGLGETHPVATNDTPQGRAQNRRVEIDIVAAPE